MQKLQDTLDSIKPLDKASMEGAQRRLDSLTKPLGSLGRLESIARQVAGIMADPVPQIRGKVIVLMAGDHGVVEEGITAYPQEVTVQMVANFLNGGAAINVLARQVGAGIALVDIGVNGDVPRGPGLRSLKVSRGTRNFLKGPAMTREEAVKALETGITVACEEIEAGADLIATGDMGIGNTTASSALLAAFSNCPPEQVVGRGTGIDDEGLKRKVEVVARALGIHRPNPSDPLGTLANLGGLEIAGLAGVILGAASRRRPVVVDGFISGAAALAACAIKPRVRDYLIPSHLSAESGHKAMMAALGLEPVIVLDMRLGEGTGAALAMFLVESSLRLMREMATFEGAGVSTALE
ncbi:MAG: nicotinate-nucleotide--dimethylbenzimidazole phosphoribosyltransferase [Bacillota bacterium]